MRRAFTLIELLVVIGIMGLLGTTAVGGYHAMQRGMEERGVMDNVNNFIRAAYQRAQIDRQPTAVYFWNETLRKADDYNAVIAVGKAVAIRRSGRFTEKEGSYLYDEFADLEHVYPTDDEEADEASEGSGDGEANTMYVYPIDALNDIKDTSNLKRSIVYQKVFHRTPATPLYLSGEAGELKDNDAPKDENGKIGTISTYALKLSTKDEGTVAWERGMAYGFEFAEITLPHGYVFGTGDGAYSDEIKNPIKTQGTLVFSVGECSGNGINGTGGIENRSGVISVSSLRPNKSGTLSAESIGNSTNPTENL